jgi:hypothetical protein
MTTDDNDDNGIPTQGTISTARIIIALITVVLIGGLVVAGLENATVIPLGKQHIHDAGPLLFGVVVGWVTYRTSRRDGSHAHISDIAAVLSALGSTAVTGLVDRPAIGWYLTGLFGGFFLFYLVHSILAEGKDKRISELLIGRTEAATEGTKLISGQ